MKDQTCSRRPAGDAGFKERKRRSPRIALCFLSHLLFTFKNGWTVISMKNDWKTIFGFESK
jgi:hypothetical protein